MPRWIQAMGIARRAELLKANNKDGEFPDGTCGIMKKWANSHRQELLKALTGLTQRPEPEEASQPSAPAAQEEAVASTPEEGLTLGQVWTCDGVYPQYLQLAGLDRDAPISAYPFGTWVCARCHCVAWGPRESCHSYGQHGKLACPGNIFQTKAG